MEARMSSSLKIRNVAECAAFLCLALSLSYLESLIPLNFIIPLPGFKLGLANLAAVIVFYRVSPAASLTVSVGRTLISFLLFTGVSSFLFSLSGAILSFAALIFSAKVFKNRISFIGLSVTMAVSHNIGQLICACLVMHSKAVLDYLPVLIIAALLCGAATGVILSALPEKLYLGKDM